ncbi:HypC/HybG/HupF family hydrogenase formation chaperone [Candidatus Woesearchaeota archaeon]|nr:HypC/HybG/HupF family hydrogenase formation chaperone [Candidatus Woesearchaeota archaeon]
MCYTIPGKVIEVRNNRAKVKYNEEIREADSSLVKVKPGDYVVVQAKFIISKVPEKEAKEVIRLWNQAT